jgi:hypothetical protein
MRNIKPSRKGLPPCLDDKVEEYLVDWILYIHKADFTVTNTRLTTEVISLAFVAGGAAAWDSVEGRPGGMHPCCVTLSSNLYNRP